MKVIKLKHPIPIKADNGSDQSVSELRFGRILVEHLQIMPKAMFEKDAEQKAVNPHDYVPLIAGMTGLTVEDINKIDLVDDFMNVVEGVVEAVGEFNTPKIGESKPTG
ncbi:phage tail assembly protein [Candidatus Pacearchaeota archaeon]|nr:phage tail assembly protein [Candidatus Pacearchaeota archaeon]